MHNLTEQFDNLVAFHGTIQLLPGTAAPFTLRDFEDTIEFVDVECAGEARAELEALLYKIGRNS